MDDAMFYDLSGGYGSAGSQGIAYGNRRFVVVSGNKIAYSN
jgi:hypothetical protein